MKFDKINLAKLTDNQINEMLSAAYKMRALASQSKAAFDRTPDGESLITHQIKVLSVLQTYRDLLAFGEKPADEAWTRTLRIYSSLSGSMWEVPNATAVRIIKTEAVSEYLTGVLENLQCLVHEELMDLVYDSPIYDYVTNEKNLIDNMKKELE